jgi:hypothetical protein
MGLQHGEDKLYAPGSGLQDNEFQNHVNFEQYVVLMPQLRRVRSYEFEYSDTSANEDNSSRNHIR